MKEGKDKFVSSTKTPPVKKRALEEFEGGEEPESSSQEEESFDDNEQGDPLSQAVTIRDFDNVTEQQKLTPCEICLKPLETGKVVIVDGLEGAEQIHHMNCFVCNVCKKPFEDQFWPFEGKSYCKQHFAEVRGWVCAKCEKIIEDVPLEAMGQYWHNKGCFSCTNCSKAFSGADVGFYQNEGKPYCVNCFRQLKASKTICARCSKPIYDRSIDALGKKWHNPDCFVCNACNNFLEDFYEHDGMPYCENCVTRFEALTT